jgi:hypothetical protein
MIYILSKRYKPGSGKVQSIVERMGCLVEVTKDARMRGGSMQGIEEGCLLTNDAVFRGVALCPMKRIGERMRFDPDEFFNIVLRESKSEGRA